MRSRPRTRSFLTLLLALTGALTVLSVGPAGAATGFGDVDDDAYYAEAVAWMVAEDITTGVEAGCFGPALDVTRGQVAAFLHRLDDSLGNTPEPTAHPFSDVVAAYQQDAVGWLYGEGLTTGVADGRYAPNRSITRGDFAVLLWRYAGSPETEGGVPFVDVTRDYQRVAVAWMAEQGITTGTTPETFDPDGTVDRAQAATFLFRYVDPGTFARIESVDTCTRGLRIALQTGGLTKAEALCAAPHLTAFDVDYLLDVVKDRQDASYDLIVAAATVGTECLTLDRIADLSRVFL